MSDVFVNGLEGDLEEVFFGPQDFTEPASYLATSGATYAIHVLFEDPYEGADPQGGAKVQTRSVRVRVRESALMGGPRPGDRLSVRGTTWRVVTAEPDGVGISTLTLQRT